MEFLGNFIQEIRQPVKIRRFIRLHLAFSIALPCFLVSSCSSIFQPPEPGELEPVLLSLEGKEPLLLSEDNKYLAPNKLVSLLQQESESIRGFIRERGVPDAVRAVDASAKEGKVEFFYLAPDELYRLEQHQGVWIVLGPEPIQREYVLPLRQAVRNRMRSGANTASADNVESNTDSQSPVIEPSSIGPGTGMSSSGSPPIEGTTSLPVARKAPSPSEIEALAGKEKLPTAKINERGDLIHVVVSSQENFQALALWYTYDEANAEKIARINGKALSEKLLPGDTIAIPSYLVKNKKSLQPGLLQPLQSLIAKSR